LLASARSPADVLTDGLGDAPTPAELVARCRI